MDTQAHAKDADKMKFKLNLSLEEEDHRHRSYHQLRNDLVHLAEITDISIPRPFPKGNGPLGKAKAATKTLVAKFLSPFIRLFFAKQIEVNQTTLFLSTKIAVLEKRIQALEEAALLEKH